MALERIRFTEYLDLDLNNDKWHCNSCGHGLISARENYKRGCLVAERDPAEIHPPSWKANTRSRQIPTGCGS